MTTFLQFAVLGLGAGAVYTLLGQGVVVIYRGSGVVNFAQGAMAMVAAFLFSSLTATALWGNLPALLAVVAGLTLLGAAMYLLVIRTLRGASTLGRVMATLALFIILQAVAVLHWGEGIALVQPIFSTQQLSLGGVSVGLDRVILAGIAGGITVILWGTFRYTVIGLATQAAAENPRAAEALGWSSTRLGTINWALGGALAAAAGVLFAPITGVQVDQLALLVIPALTAALIGNFSSFPLTFVSGMLLGIAQSEVSNYVNLTGASEALPFFALVGFLILGGRGLPLRGHVAERAAYLGSGRVRTRPLIVAVACLLVLCLTVFSADLNGAITASVGFGVVMLSVVLCTGYAGQLSLAQMSIAGIGALAAGQLVVAAHWPFELAFLASIAIAVPIGLLFAIPALRTRGFTLGMVTLGLGGAVEALVFNNPRYVGNGDGTPVGGQHFFGVNIDPVTHAGRFTALTLVVFVLCGLAVANVRRGTVGRRLVTMRENERAAASIGIGVYGAKMYAFALAAAIAAVGGVLLGFQFQTIVYSTYAPLQSILAVAFTVIGGLGFALGAVYGAFFVAGGIGSWFLDHLGNGLDRWLALIGGISLLVYLLQDPDGMARFNQKAFQRFAGRWERRESTTRPSPESEYLGNVNTRRVQPKTLEVTDLHVRYGGVTALAGATLTVAPGTVSALIGPNGAGKTTLIDCVTGFVKAAEGCVTLDKMRIDTWSVHRRARAGIARSFQGLELFEGLSVRENLYAASDRGEARAYVTAPLRPGAGRMSDEAIRAIREFDLADDLDKLPSSLPYGRRRLVAIARALATSPSILLLDEPAAGLDESESAELAHLVRGIAKEYGVGVLVVEHDMNFVMNVADHVTVLDFGRQIADGPPAEIRRMPEVIAAYLGDPDEALIHAEA